MAKRIIRWFFDRKIAVCCSVVFAALSISLAIPRLTSLDASVLRMSAGPDFTRRHDVAVYLTEKAAENDLSIKLVTNEGTEDCLKRMLANELDAAIVSSGVVVPNDSNLMGLGAIQLEAVHVLVRKEMAEAGPLFKTIQGKRLNLGVKGSTEWLLARDFLDFAKLKLPSAKQPGDVIPLEYSKEELLNKSRDILQAVGERKDLLTADMPDCLIVLASMPSPIVQLLVEAVDYQIMPLPATRAFLLDNLQDSHAKTTVIQREFLEPTSILSHSYFGNHAFPEIDCETVGVRLLVVARKDLPARAVQALMKTIFEGEFAHRIQPKSPRDLAMPYSIHPAAITYLDRDKPLVVNALLEWLSNGLSIFGAFVAGVLSFYSLIRRTSLRSPSNYFAEIREVEQLALAAREDTSALIQKHEVMKPLNERLLRLRYDFVNDICQGNIKGDQVISNILTLMKDARRNLETADRNAVGTHDGGSGIFHTMKEAA